MSGAFPPISLRYSTDLTLEVFEEIVWDGRALALAPELLSELAAARAAMEHALQRGEAVYGVNTGMGYLSTVRLSTTEQEQHAANLFLGRAVGGPPFLHRGEARALLLARLAGFLSGHAGVTPHLCSFIVDRLNDDFVPAIPRTDLGSAGEIIPLSHAFGTLLGLGEVLAHDETTHSAATALQERHAAPFRPTAKEGIALLAGAPGTLALAIAHRRTISVLLGQLTVCWACAIDAIGTPHAPYDPALAALWHDPVMPRVLNRLGKLLRGAGAGRSVTQAPVSFRVIPQVLVHLHRTLDRLEEDIRRALPAVTDSPVFVEGRFLTNGGFHDLGLAFGLDALCIALVQAAELSAQHVHRLLDHRFSGLPDQLTASPGPQTGLIVVHKRVTGAVHRLRRLAMPASVGMVDTSFGQEDAMTFAFEAAEKLRTVEQVLRDVIACELLVSRQAWALREAPPADGLREYAAELADIVEPVEQDRRLGSEIDALAALVSMGAFQ
jgi:histidine ammonia-lyase